MQMQWGTLKEKIPFGLVVAFVAGLLIGLFVLGWWLWPVEYTETDFYALRDRHKVTYVQLVADSYTLTRDLPVAKRRLQELESADMSAEVVAQLVAQVAGEKAAEGNAEAAARLQNLAADLGVQPVVAEPTAPAQPPEQEPEEGGGFFDSVIVRICGILLAALLLIVGVLLFVSYLRRRSGGSRLQRRPMPTRDLDLDMDQDEQEVGEWSPEDVEWDTPPPPVPGLSLGHFVTTFELGDDGYDESFGIETDTGEFLGECGVAISEVIGSGTEKPIAFDVWLFDKTDIRTVTTVVVSDYAAEDEGLRAKLAAKGDVIVAERGQVLQLETATLQVKAEIVDLSYGEGGELPDDSYFEKFTVELSPGTKEA